MCIDVCLCESIILCTFNVFLHAWLSLTVCLFVCPSSLLSVCLPVCPSVYVVWLPVSRSVHISFSLLVQCFAYASYDASISGARICIYFVAAMFQFQDEIQQIAGYSLYDTFGGLLGLAVAGWEGCEVCPPNSVHWLQGI